MRRNCLISFIHAFMFSQWGILKFRQNLFYCLTSNLFSWAFSFLKLAILPRDLRYCSASLSRILFCIPNSLTDFSIPVVSNPDSRLSWSMSEVVVSNYFKFAVVQVWPKIFHCPEYSKKLIFTSSALCRLQLAYAVGRSLPISLWDSVGLEDKLFCIIGILKYGLSKEF
jgi:hypothetical protein